MQGRPTFDGYLAHETAEVIAHAMRSVLDGRRYSFIAVNEMFGYRPEVRTGLELREPIQASYYGENAADRTSVMVGFNDQDYVCSIHTRAVSEDDACKLDDTSFDRVRVTVRPDQVWIEHRVPAGGRLWWVLATNDEKATDQ